MCDYSLMAVPNRLARKGEKLVVHRFSTGSLGLASVSDLNHVSSSQAWTWWTAVKEFFNPLESGSTTAVCVPPGARLRLHEIPARLQKEWGTGSDESVTFTQIAVVVNSYRDAVRLNSGREV